MSIPAETPGVAPTVTLVPGAGIVVRTPAYLCVMADSVPAAFLTDLLDIESSVAVPDSAPRRGRHLVRALAQLVATAETTIDIAFAAPDNVGVAIFLSGGVYGETDGKRIEPGPDGPYDKALPWPFEGLGLYLDGTVPAEVGEERFDLVEGVVPAAGALLHTPLGLRSTEFHAIPAAPPAQPQAPSDVRSEKAEPVGPAKEPEPVPEPRSAPEPGPVQAPERPSEPEREPEPASTIPPAPVPPVAPAPPMSPPVPVPEPLPFTSTPLGGPAAQASALPPAPPTPPLPKQEHRRPATEVVKVEASRARVHGIRCARGHLNHPQSWLCGVCGIRMDQLTTFLVEGERPPLGWLLLDNGFTFLLDEDLVIGREPEPDPARGRGRGRSPKPIRVQDETGQLSRRHVEIRLVEWTVQLVDLGSANGTFVTDPSSGNRETRLLPHRPHVLIPGSHVRLGGRHFIFESHHARI